MEEESTVEVALRKESVDRNSDGVVSGSADYVSLSARRAWIEIVTAADKEARKRVALRKESVDRNFCHEIQAYTCSRSPQGERG